MNLFFMQSGVVSLYVCMYLGLQYTLDTIKMWLFLQESFVFFVFGLSLFFYFYEINLPTRSEEDWSSVTFK